MSQEQTNTATAPVAVKAPGRPIVPGSKRQQILADKEARRAAGTLKKGRPVSETSKAAERRALAAKKEKLGVNKPGFNKAKLLKMGIDPVTFDIIGTDTTAPVVMAEEAVTE